jgi:predicted nucleic acid-binding protein
MMLQKKLKEAISGDHAHVQTSEDYIRELDMKNKRARLEKKQREKQRYEERLNLIFENMPYAYEACKFDR